RHHPRRGGRARAALPRGGDRGAVGRDGPGQPRARPGTGATTLCPGTGRGRPQAPCPARDSAGSVDLIATSPPYACSVGTIDKAAWLSGRSLCDKESLNYSASRSNLGHARDEHYLAQMAQVYVACHAVLAPGGLLVTVTKNLRRQG